MSRENYGAKFARGTAQPLAAGAPMTFERFKAIAKSIDLRMFPLPMEFAVDNNIEAMAVRVVVTYRAPDIRDGRQGPIVHAQFLPWIKAEEMSDLQALEYLYAQAKTAVLHEFNESFLVCGKRVFNPHGDEPGVVTPKQAERYRTWRNNWTLPDPLPPPLPRQHFSRDMRRIDVVGLVGAPKLFSGGWKPEDGDQVTASRYVYLPTGELVDEPRKE